jgi:GxxExxY protein
MQRYQRTIMLADEDLKRENELSRLALNICFDIHKQYGPGLFESVYEEIFWYEFSKEGIVFERQKAIPLYHNDLKMDIGFRVDFLIENKLLIELKSIETLADVHYRQVQTYLRLTNAKLGLLINFNVSYLRDGLKRIINSSYK